MSDCINALPKGALLCDAPSASRYARGCRCEACTTAQRDRMRVYFQAKGGNKARKPEVEAARYQRRHAAGWPTWTPERRAHSERRRAAKLGADSEQFTHLQIFKRDGWVCGICAEPVDRSLRHPDPLSPSLDHVLPLSLGGHHTRANTRCAHLVCNIRRGNRVEPEALAASA